MMKPGLLVLLHLAATPLLAGPVVTGTLLDAGGAPLPDARIELLHLPSSFEAGRLRVEGRDLPPPVATARADAHGRYVLEAPQAGVWKLVTRAAGSVPLQYGPVLLLEDEELPVALIPRDAGLRVRVQSESGQPAAGVWVLATPAGEAVQRSAGWRPEFRVGHTAADGALTLPRTGDERLRVSVFPSGQTTEVEPSLLETTVRLRPPGRASVLQVLAPGALPAAGVLVRVGEHAWPA